MRKIYVNASEYARLLDDYNQQESRHAMELAALETHYQQRIQQLERELEEKNNHGND